MNDPVGLEKLLLDLNDNMETAFLKIQEATSSHKNAEEALATWQLFARGEEIQSKTVADRQQDMKRMIEKSMGILHKSQAIVDGANVAISGVMKSTEFTYQRHTELEVQVLMIKEEIGEIKEEIGETKEEIREVKDAVNKLMRIVGDAGEQNVSQVCHSQGSCVIQCGVLRLLTSIQIGEKLADVSLGGSQNN